MIQLLWFNLVWMDGWKDGWNGENHLVALLEVVDAAQHVGLPQLLFVGYFGQDVEMFVEGPLD